MQANYKTGVPKKLVNLSGLADKAIASTVRACLAEAWLAENASAIQAYNERVESKGVFSDGLRRF